MKNINNTKSLKNKLLKNKNKNASPPRPIEVTTRVNFQHRGQLSFV